MSTEIKPAENKMGTMPIGKLLFTMSAPMVASMMFQALYNIVDSVFVARLGQDALNAVSLAFPLQMLCMSFGVGTGVGVNALLSRSLGQKDQKKADETANSHILITVLMGIFFAILGIFVARPFFVFQTNNTNIINYGSNYILVVMGCSIFLFSQICMERLLQSTGKTNLAMIPQLIGAIINMCLDPVFIFGLFGAPRLEVKGAAVATIFGQTIATIIGFTLNKKYNHEIHLKLSEVLKFHGSTIKDIFKIGFPSIVMQCIGSFMNLGINKILISFTEAATAVFGAYYKIQSFIFLPVFGLNNATVPIISFNYGARKPERYKKTLKLAIISAVGIMTIGTILFETIPQVLLGLFKPSAEMLLVGKSAFRIIGLHFPLAGFCIVAVSVCQALEKPQYSLITSICRQLVVLLPAAYLLSKLGNVSYVWFAFVLAEFVSLILSFIFLNKTLKAAAKRFHD